MDEKVTSRSCSFCSNVNAIYTCPRCCSPYCSKSCYQSQQHAECSEQFYKEWVEAELQLDEPTNKNREDVMNMLSRLEENSATNDFLGDKDSDDESVPDLCERLENVDLDDADKVWDCLTEQEKLEFQSILDSGNISHLIPEYEPWWSKRYEKKIEDLNAFLSKENKKNYETLCPPVKNIAPFSTVSKVKPSSCVLWNILNVIGSYTFVARRYNGEHLEYCTEAANIITSVSETLNSNLNFDSKQAAIDSVTYNLTNNQNFNCSKEEVDTIPSDIDSLASGPENSEPSFYVLAALSDVHHLLSRSLSHNRTSKQKSKSEFSKKFPNVPLELTNKDKVRRCVKKIDFYLSWAKEYYTLDLVYA